MSRSDRRQRRVAAERFGRWAEWRCVWRLRLAGYGILARRYRTPVGEIDIIAWRRDLLVFIEVKARGDLETALHSVSEAQLRRMARAGESFVARHGRFAAAGRRYDIMAVGRGLWPRHVRDAWRPPAELG